ncbi:MAG: hypothetical protein M0R39_17085 [Prolixibacteraceae bacterium]|nr:hypothetical protein [Prolixibacteraceae bacterium]
MTKVRVIETIVMIIELIVVFVASNIFWGLAALVSCFDACPEGSNGPSYLPFFIMGLILLIVIYLLQDRLIFKKLIIKSKAKDKKK